MSLALLSQIRDQSLFVLHGDSALLKSRALAAIVHKRLPEADRDLGLTQLHAAESELPQIIGAFSSGSLFATQQVLVLRDLDHMPRTQQQQLVSALEAIGADLSVVMTCSPSARGRSSEPNLSAPLVRLVKSKGLIVNCNSPVYLEWKDELTPWVGEEVRRHGKSLAAGAVQLLIDTVGPDCDRLASEITKLAMYVGDSAQIAAEDVRVAASAGAEQDIFGLTDAIGRRDVGSALATLPALLPAHASRGAGIPIVGMIARHLRLLWQCRHLLDNRVSLLSADNCPDRVRQQLPEQHGIFDTIRGKRPIARKFTEQARHFSERQLARGLVEVYQTDMALKGQSDQALDDRAQLELLVISLCRL